MGKNGTTPKEATLMLSRYESMRTARSSYNQVCQEVLEYCMPHKASVLQRLTPGQVPMSKVFDTTAIHSLDILASSLHGMLTNPTADWFNLLMEDEALNRVLSVREWLQGTTKTMQREIRDSNWDSQAHQMYLDLGSVAQGLVFVTENEGRDGLHFTACHISECYTALNNKGEVDTVYRKFPMSVRAAAKEFGRAALPIKQKKMLDDPAQVDTQVEYLHVTEPRDDRDPKRSDKLNKPFKSVYLDFETGKVVQESGFEEFPWIAPRWLVVSGEETGRSPAMLALPDVRMVNRMMRTTIRGGEKAVDPPTLLPDDGVLRPYRMKAGGINYYDAKRPDLKVEQMPVGDPKLGVEIISLVRQSIQDAFYIDQLDFTRDPQMTATEVMQRDDRQRRVLSPILGRQNSETLKPLIRRVFGLLWRMGKITPPPPEVAKQRMIVQYTSPLAKAQRTQEAQVLAMSMNSALPLAQYDPTVLDLIDFDVVVRTGNELLGGPAQVLRDDKAVADIRQARQQRAEQMQRQQQAMQGLEALQQAGDAGQSLAQAQAMAQQSGQGQPGIPPGGLYQIPNMPTAGQARQQQLRTRRAA